MEEQKPSATEASEQQLIAYTYWLAEQGVLMPPDDNDPRDAATLARDFTTTNDGEQGGEREVGGIAAIAAERWRQIDEEGYTAEHDEHHSVRQFVATALAYLGAPNRAAWPIKRADPESGYFQRRDLVKAGALVAAAIDRLDAEESR